MAPNAQPRRVPSQVDKVLAFAPDTELFVTGHSLGGALSVLCARLTLTTPCDPNTKPDISPNPNPNPDPDPDPRGSLINPNLTSPSPPCSCGIRLALKFPDRKVQVINFGCPKVGNAAFAKLVNTTTNLCVQRVAHKRDIITRGPNLDFNHVGHTIQIDEALDVKPRAHKWHAGLHAMTNWNPMMGSGSDHLISSYLKALHSHKHDGANCKGEKAWVHEYTTQQ